MMKLYEEDDGEGVRWEKLGMCEMEGDEGRKVCSGCGRAFIL